MSSKSLRLGYVGFVKRMMNSKSSEQSSSVEDNEEQESRAG